MSNKVSLKDHFEALRAADQRALDVAFKGQEKLMEAIERNNAQALTLADTVMQRWKTDHNDLMKEFAERERKFFPTTLGYVATLLGIAGMILSMFTYLK